jgi:hypothetical protein
MKQTSEQEIETVMSAKREDERVTLADGRKVRCEGQHHQMFSTRFSGEGERGFPNARLDHRAIFETLSVHERTIAAQAAELERLRGMVQPDAVTGLVRCPFCGSNDLEVREEVEHGGLINYVICLNCVGQCGRGQWSESRDWAVRAWNRRVAPSSAVGEER